MIEDPPVLIMKPFGVVIRYSVLVVI